MIAEARNKRNATRAIVLSIGVSALALSGCTSSSGPSLEMVGQGFSQNQGVNVVGAPQNGSFVPLSRPQNIEGVTTGQQTFQQPSDIAALSSDSNLRAPDADTEIFGTEIAQTDALSATGIAATSQFAVTPAPQAAFPSLPEGTVIAAANPLPTTNIASENTINAPAMLQTGESTFSGQGVLATGAVAASAAQAPPAASTTKAARPVGQGLFASLFSKRPSQEIANSDAAPKQAFAETSATTINQRIAQAAPAPKPLSVNAATTQSQFVTATRAAANIAPRSGTQSGLPGVNTTNLFSINDEDENEPTDDLGRPLVQLASATPAGLARLTPNSIATQTDRVDVDCFKPELVRVLQRIERHYGKKAIVTSGYRSLTGNSRSGGSSKSLHMYCAAADIQVEGVSKWELAKYVRSMPGRGGVGTYCHTKSVHVDIGSKRDWNWRCRRR